MSCQEEGTGWYQLWFANAIVMLVQSLNFIVLALGSWNYQLRLYGTIVNCACGIITLIMALVTVITRFNPMGTICAKNIAVVDYDSDGQFEENGRTYADDATMLATFGCIGFVLMCGQLTCCVYPLYSTPVAKEKKEKTETKTSFN